MDQFLDKFKEHNFSTLIPEIQLYVINQGIESTLNTNSDIVVAILSAFSYLHNVTATNKFLKSQQPHLKRNLLKIAKQKFASEFVRISQEGFTKELDSVRLDLARKARDLRLGYPSTSSSSSKIFTKYMVRRPFETLIVNYNMFTNTVEEPLRAPREKVVKFDTGWGKSKLKS